MWIICISQTCLDFKSQHSIKQTKNICIFYDYVKYITYQILFVCKTLCDYILWYVWSYVTVGVWWINFWTVWAGKYIKINPNLVTAVLSNQVEKNFIEHQNGCKVVHSFRVEFSIKNWFLIEKILYVNTTYKW